MIENSQIVATKNGEKFWMHEGRDAVLKAGRLGRFRTEDKLRSGSIRIPWLLVAWAALSFLLARAEILGGLYPFIPAFLAVLVLNYNKKSIYALIPAFLGFFSVMGVEQLLIYTAISAVIVLALIFYPLDGRKQWLVTPVIVFMVVMTVKGLFLVFSGFDSYLLWVVIVEGALASGMTVVFLVLARALRRLDGSHRFSADEVSCFFVLAMGMIAGMANWQIGGLDMQSVFSRFLIIVVAYLAGGGAGAGIGAMIGIVPSLSAVVSPSLVATYAFSGLLAGLFSNFGRVGTVLGFFVGNLILAMYLLDATQISSSLAATAVAAIIFFVIPKSVYKELRFIFSSAVLKTAKEEKNEQLMRFSMRRLRNASFVFNNLGNTLHDMVKEEKGSENKDEADAQMIVNLLSRQLCQQCSMYKICWDLDYRHTYRGIMKLFQAIEERGESSVKDMPENFAKRCPHLKELVAISNCLYEMYCQQNYWKSRQDNLQALISRQLLGVSQVLSNIASEVGDQSDKREILERDLSGSLAKRGLPVENAGVFKITKKALDVFVQYSECPGAEICCRAVEDEISRMSGRNYDVHEYKCGGDNCAERCRYRLLADGAFSLNIGQVQLAKDHKEVCGDSGGHILLDEGRKLLMICDGMGVGQRAAVESDTALNLVSRLIEAGFSEETAIDTVDVAMSLRNDKESFVTMDLCLVDLYSGRAQFIKSGSAPSFIKRGSVVKMIKSSSLPVGMVMAMQKDQLTEQILPGDMIILASDGLDANLSDDGRWLQVILEQAQAESPQAMAQYLMNKVISVSGGKIKDDITILVAQMEAL
ncbi:MAG: stage II sporulation protein E [Bacillota bacterium]|jgi:stage II sporulation protein E